MRRKKILFLTLFVVLVNISCDQVTKAYARKNYKYRGTINVIDKIVVIRYAENDGGFLSLGSGLPKGLKKWLFTIFPLVTLLGLVLFVLLNRKETIFQVICLASVIGGGISNIVDRIAGQGMVTDFIQLGVGPVRTGILNGADLSITFGVILYLFHAILTKSKHGESSQSPTKSVGSSMKTGGD